MAKKARLSKMAKDLKTETQEDRNADLQQSKIKATYTLSAELLTSLESGQAKMRGLVKPKIRGKINRSLIVELALKTALNELSTHGIESQIYRNTETYLSGVTD